MSTKNEVEEQQESQKPAETQEQTQENQPNSQKEETQPKEKETKEQQLQQVQHNPKHAKSEQSIQSNSINNNSLQLDSNQRSLLQPQHPFNESIRQSPKQKKSPYAAYAQSYQKYKKKHMSIQFGNQSQNSVFQAMQDNKTTGIKLQVLTNRLNKLAEEECILTRKAKEAQERANSIFELKRREEMKREEARRKKIEVEDVKNTYPISQLDMAKCKMSRQFISDRNLEEGVAWRRESQKMANIKAIQEQMHLDDLKEKASQLKEMKQNGTMRRSNFFTQKKEEIQSGQLSVFEQERMKQRRKEELLKELERMEQEHLEKLNTTKLKNTEALKQLEYSMVSHSKEYEEKFGNALPQKKGEKTINGHPESKFQNHGPGYFLENDQKSGQSVLKTRY